MRKYITIILLTSALISSCGKVMSRKDDLTGIQGKKIVETGELAAVNSKSFVVERYGYWYQMKIIGLIEHGSIVNPGDSLIQFDPSDINKAIIDWETNLETQQASFEKLLVEQKNRENELTSSIKSETATFETKKLELSLARFETEKYQKIKELEFEQAKINFEKQKRKIELNKITSECDYKIQKIRVKQLEDRIQDAKNIIPRLTIRTPIAGVFQISHGYDGSMLKVGDNIYQGWNMAKVPELEWMKVNTFINETDFLKIKVGQKVAVRLDAMPELEFDGVVDYIGKLCQPREQNSRQKGFEVEVKLLKSDERLKPGMTVSCEYL